MFCSGCGEEVLDTAIICPKCGSPVGKKKKETEEVSPGLLFGGYIGAIFFPIVGIIIGIILLVKGAIGHGIGQIVLAIVMSVIWLSAI